MKSLLRLAAWFALAAGLVEAALLVAHGRQIHGFIYLSPHLVWMAPAMNLVWFGMAALLLGGLGRIRPSWSSPRAAIFAFTFLAALAILLLPSQLHRLAAVVIALGLAAQATRMLTPRLDWFARLTARTLPLMAALVVLALAGTAGWSAWRERRAVGALGPAPPGAPNILLIVLDTVRRASLSLYGYERPTWPHMERWAARGVRFDHAFATASWTLPSHASMFNGRLPGDMSAGWLAPLDDAHPVLAERLQAAGYGTAGFVANVLYGNRSFGLGRGFLRYEDYRISPGEMLVNSSLGRALSECRLLRRLTGWYDIAGRKSGRQVTNRFLAWQARQRDRPWFAFLNYFDAHQPYLPPAELAGAFGPVDDRNFGLLELRPYMGKLEAAETALTPAQVESERNAYEATLAYLDREMDRLLGELERRGDLENTIVVITSDHGEQFMEHGLFDHGNSLYRYATEVPLVMIGGPAAPGGVVTEPVSLQHLPVTLLGLAGVDRTGFPGTSLLGQDRNGAPPPPVISETRGPGLDRRFHAVVAQGYHAVWSADSVELFDFGEDPGEQINLARSPAGAATLIRLRSFLDSAIAGRRGNP